MPACVRWSSRPSDGTPPVILPLLPGPHPTPVTCSRPDSRPANGSTHETNRIDENGSTWNQVGVQPSFAACLQRTSRGSAKRTRTAQRIRRCRVQRWKEEKNKIRQRVRSRLSKISFLQHSQIALLGGVTLGEHFIQSVLSRPFVALGKGSGDAFNTWGAGHTTKDRGGPTWNGHRGW